MTIQLNLPSTAARFIWGVTALAVGGLFVGAVFVRFVTVVVSDPQIEIHRQTLIVAAQQFPQSANIHARLAARLIETGGEKNERFEDMVQQALHHSSRAVQLAPWKSQAWVLLAAARELSGDLAQAEMDLRTALSRAPQQTSLNWRLANLLLRKGQLQAAIPEFRGAIATDNHLLPATLPLLWQATNGQLAQVATIVPQQSYPQLVFAKFLAQRKHPEAAIQILERMDRKLLLNYAESKHLLDILLTTKEFAAADQVWQHLFGLRTGGSLLWNSGFEAASYEGFNHFDWQLSDSQFARVRVTGRASHTGEQSLSLEYSGIETTRLEQEIKQLIPVRTGLHYRLECYVKTDALVTEDGPRVVITKPDAATIVAETPVVAAGTHDWQLLTVDFIAPTGTSALLVTIRQTPRFTYSPPTKGTVWFDDFVVKER